MTIPSTTFPDVLEGIESEEFPAYVDIVVYGCGCGRTKRFDPPLRLFSHSEAWPVCRRGCEQRNRLAIDPAPEAADA